MPIIILGRQILGIEIEINRLNRLDVYHKFS